MSACLSENINALLKGPAGWPWWESPASHTRPPLGTQHSPPRGAAHPSWTTGCKSQSNTESPLELENCVNLNSGRLAQSNLVYSRKICDPFCIKKNFWSSWFSLLTSPGLVFTSLSLSCSRTDVISELMGSWQDSVPLQSSTSSRDPTIQALFLAFKFACKTFKGELL